MKLESLGYSMGDAWSVTNAYTVDLGVSVVGGAATGAGGSAGAAKVEMRSFPDVQAGGYPSVSGWKVYAPSFRACARRRGVSDDGVQALEV